MCLFQTRRDKVIKLLEIMPRRSDKAYTDFIEVLDKIGQGFLANKLR